MITLKESLLSKTKDKVEDMSKKSADDLAKVAFDFPDEERGLHYAQNGVVYYQWYYQPLIDENEDLIKKFIALYKWPRIKWPTGRLGVFNRLEIYVKLIPMKGLDGVIHRFVEVGLQQSQQQRLSFRLDFEGGSKKSVIHKMYKLLGYIRDEEGLFNDILKASVKQEEPFDAGKRLSEKYNIRL